MHGHDPPVARAAHLEFDIISAGPGDHPLQLPVQLIAVGGQRKAFDDPGGPFRLPKAVDRPSSLGTLEYAPVQVELPVAKSARQFRAAKARLARPERPKGPVPLGQYRSREKPGERHHPEKELQGSDLPHGRQAARHEGAVAS